MSTYNIYLALIAQLDKLARHNRQGSFQTKRRYYEAMQRFCRYLAEEYHLQKLSNISGKHFAAYVEYLQNSGKSASTIKTDLAAIRFFHDKDANAKYRLPANDELAVELVNMGCALQASADFIEGGRMGKEKRPARELFRRGLYTYIASDAHFPHHYDVLAKAVKKFGN